MESAKPLTPDESEFRRLCMAHDLTFIYSDDDRAYQAGQATRADIEAFIPRIGRVAAVRIWNEVVDAKLLPECAKDFHWQDAIA
jgi:hypothetical protein